MNAIPTSRWPLPAETQTPAAAVPPRARTAPWRGGPLPPWRGGRALGVTGSWWFTEGRYIESTDNAYVQGDIAVLSPRIEGDVAASRSPTTSASMPAIR